MWVESGGKFLTYTVFFSCIYCVSSSVAVIACMSTVTVIISTYLRCDGKCYTNNVANFLLILTVKDFGKLLTFVKVLWTNVEWHVFLDSHRSVYIHCEPENTPKYFCHNNLPQNLTDSNKIWGVVKTLFSQTLSLHSHLSLPQADLLLELWPLVVWQSLAV